MSKRKYIFCRRQYRWEKNKIRWRNQQNENEGKWNSISTDEANEGRWSFEFLFLLRQM